MQERTRQFLGEASRDWLANMTGKVGLVLAFVAATLDICGYAGAGLLFFTGASICLGISSFRVWLKAKQQLETAQGEVATLSEIVGKQTRAMEESRTEMQAMTRSLSEASVVLARRLLQEQLARLQNDGLQLMKVCIDGQGEPPVSAVNAWVSGAEAFVLANFGIDSIQSFCLPVGEPNPSILSEQSRTLEWSVRGRIVRLMEFSAKLGSK